MPVPVVWYIFLLQILGVCDNHVSLYQLTVERGTQLFKWVEKQEVTMPDSDAMADMYLEAVKVSSINWMRGSLRISEISMFPKSS